MTEQGFIEYPEDMYTTKEEAHGAKPQPIPDRKPIAPFKYAKIYRKANVQADMDALQLPDADLPLFTPQGRSNIVSAQNLLDECRSYLPPSDIDKIREAYKYADSAHLGQFRKSGEPYITHPISVASILASWKMDAQTIQAGLMHDVLEDTQVGKREMAELFGIEVAELVDGVSKLDKLRFSSNEIAQAESFRKMLLAMSRDVRVILVKLADRLHNLRTLGVMRPEKRARIAKETLDIYVPIAHRLGLNNVFRELQELSFANRFPLRYKVLYENVLKTRRSRRSILEKILKETKTALTEAGTSCRILGRDKTIYGIYNKMREKRQSFSDALDIYGFRIVVKSLADCYQTLGTLHHLYKPVHNRFKDFIAIPKSNGYQSLHTTVIGPDGTPIEYQIRTEEMHRVDEDGILVHWMFDSDDDSSDLQSKVTAWLQNLLEIQRTSEDSAEFLENIKVDLFPNRIYVFTPRGRIISLPKGSTPIDFAYEIHTDIGNHAKSARINGEVKDLFTPLRNGDMVQIDADKDAAPTPNWIEHVRSGRARAEIRQYLRNCQFEESVRLGRKEFSEIASEEYELTRLPKFILNELFKDFGADSIASLYASMGLGKHLPATVLHRILALTKKDGEAELPSIVVNPSEGSSVQLASCCHPIPGDKAVGTSRPGIGLVVHRADCPHIAKAKETDPNRWMTIEWAEETTQLAQFVVPLEVKVKDAHAGLATAATKVGLANSSIVGIALDESNPDEPIVRINVQMRDKSHLMHVIRTIKDDDVVLKVRRLSEDFGLKKKS